MPTENHKDYFSSQASVYAAFRPTYPASLYAFIFQHLKHRESAWDCATGNGQVAQYLAGHFRQVYATDISQKQLNEATPLSNIRYALAEKTDFADKQFDLVTVGQALHWFDRPNSKVGLPRKSIKVHQSNPFPLLLKALAGLWSSDEVKHVRFPVFLKLGLVE